MPTSTPRDNNPQHPILSAVRESQTALIDVVRSWTDITEQLTRRLPLPVAGIDLAGAVDRTFDLAEQALAAQRQFALTLVGAVDRQVDTVVETVESSTRERLRGVEEVLREAEDDQPQPGRERPERPTAAKAELARAKGHVKGSLVLSGEDPGSRMNRLGRQQLTTGEILSIDELIERFDGLAMDDIDRVADRVLGSRDFKVTVVGPFEQDAFEAA